MAELPPCPRGHTGVKVVRDGVQRRGGRERQRYRCVAPDGSYHRFLGALGRTRTDQGTCLECENHIAVHEGPAAPAEFEYLVREIADALVALGRGSSYTDTARRVRLMANVGKTGERRDVVNGQTVAEWVADFAPVVAARHQEAAWPECLVLDSTEFQWTNPWNGVKSQLFHVFAAYGYPSTGGKGRLWKLWASPTDQNTDWEAFLRLLPGKPLSVVCDRDLAIIGGVQRVWGKGKTAVPIHLCEYHLLNKGREALARDKLAFGDPAWDLLHESLQTPLGWDLFAHEVQQHSAWESTNKWVKHWDRRMRAQTARRATLPPVYGNGAVEAPIKRVRTAIEKRSWTFRNRQRMNMLLELVRLADLRADNPSIYAADIREHLLAYGGHPPRHYRKVYDTWGPRNQQQTRIYSLRA